jgi:hypothetical protein
MSSSSINTETMEGAKMSAAKAAKLAEKAKKEAFKARQAERAIADEAEKRAQIDAERIEKEKVIAFLAEERAIAIEKRRLEDEAEKKAKEELKKRKAAISAKVDMLGSADAYMYKLVRSDKLNY